MKKQSVYIALAVLLLLSACGAGAQPDLAEEPTANTVSPPAPVSQPPVRVLQPSPSGVYAEPELAEPSQVQTHAFYDLAIMESIERYFSKSANELTSEDFSIISQLHAFNFSIENNYIRTLRDLPELFMELRYVSLVNYWFDEAQISLEDCLILENLESLRAVDIYTDVLPSLEFAKNLPYVSITYTKDATLSIENNLAEASVLGKDFIESHISGNPSEYIRVADGVHIYELIVTDMVTSELEEAFEQHFEAIVFISEYSNGEYHFLESIVVPRRIGNLSGGLILSDVDFDGNKDVLVSQGHFGAQGLVTFACFMHDDGEYSLNTSFSDICNPAIDNQNKEVLSTWRNWAASHSWAMYSYINGVFVQTDCLTQEPEEWGEGSEILTWKHEIEHFNGGNTDVEVYLTCDYSDDEWGAMFYDENSFWGLYSDKWRTLHNQGTLYDWSLYGNNFDAQVMEKISDLAER